MKYKGELALLIAAALYGFFGVFSRIINFNLPLFFQAWTRNVLATLIIFALVKFFGRWKKIKPGHIKWFIFRGLGGFISFISLYIGFIYLDFSTNYFISYATATITGYLFGYLFFKEKLTRVNLMALLLSTIGLYLIFKITLRADKLIYLLISALGGIATSVWMVFSKKISGTYSNLQLNMVDSILALALPFALSVIFKEPWTLPALNWLWGANLLFAGLFMATGFLIVYGFSKVEAQKGSLILLFDILVGILLGYIMFHETISLQAFFGGLFILAAMILPNIKKSWKKCHYPQNG